VTANSQCGQLPQAKDGQRDKSHYLTFYNKKPSCRYRIADRTASQQAI